jgi:hypothetical protein
MDGLIAGIAFGILCGLFGFMAGERSNISAKDVHRAVIVCESNGGLKAINGVWIKCSNGAIFDLGARP